MTEAPRPGVEGLTRAGRRERTRRRGLGAGASATVAVVVLALGSAALGSGRSSGPGPGPAAPTSSALPTPRGGALPLGPGTPVPWMHEGRVHVGDHSYEVIPSARPTESVLRYASGTTVVDFSAAGSEVVVIRDGAQPRQVPIAEGTTSSVVLSPNGRQLAWIETVFRSTSEGPGPGVPAMGFERFRIVSYDVGTGQVADSVTTTATSTPFLQGILADGRVVVATDGAAPAELWTPGAGGGLQPVSPPIAGRRSAGVPSWPGGLAYRFADGATSPGFLRPVGADKSLGVEEFVDRSDRGLWNPSGTAMAYESDRDDEALGGAVVVTEVSDSYESFGPTPLALPGPPSSWSVVAWEDDTHLVVVQDRDSKHPVLARCDLEAGTCEQVADGPTGASGFPAEVGD